ncbi:MAG: hypothetical protein AAFX87_07955, partial [Bacteroidota bacterium]
GEFHNNSMAVNISDLASLCDLVTVNVHNLKAKTPTTKVEDEWEYHMKYVSKLSVMDPLREEVYRFLNEYGNRFIKKPPAVAYEILPKKL